MSLDLTRIPTPHISATKEEIADVVLMPGDPLRSKYIAETYLEEPVLVNNIRGVQGYTGSFEGKKVTVMASGIGIPSISLYTYELFNFYDVDAIIRVGTAGSINPEMKVGDLLLAHTALTDSDFLTHFRLPEDYVPQPDEALLRKAVGIAEEELQKKEGSRIHNGVVLTEEIYYSQEDGDMIGYWTNRGVDAFEMEAAALYANAAQAGKKSLAVFTVSNNILTGEEMDPKDRETALDLMIRTALRTAVE